MSTITDCNNGLIMQISIIGIKDNEKIMREHKEEKNTTNKTRKR